MQRYLLVAMLCLAYVHSYAQSQPAKSKVYDFNISKKENPSATGSSGTISFNMSNREREYSTFYSAEIQQEKELSGLFKPQGEFEKKEMYQARLQQASVFSQELNKKYEAKYKIYLEGQEQALRQRIRNSYTQIPLEIEDVSRYNADDEFFSIQIKKRWSQVKVPLAEAESFKANFKKAKVTADVQLKEDGQNYDTFNIKILHPVTGTSYSYGQQRASLYMAQITKQSKQNQGVPDLKTTVEFVEPSGNKLLDAGENASIEIKVTNDGSGTATGIHTLINPASYPNLQINKPLAIPTLEPGKSTKTVVQLVAGSRLPTGDINLNISFSEDQWFQPKPFNITIQTQGLKAPNISLKEYGIKETNGNLNNIIERGESITLTAILENTGGLSAENVEVSLISDDNDVKLIDKDNPSVQKIGSLKSGDTKLLKFSFAVNNRYAGTGTLPLKLGVLHNDEPGGRYLPLKLNMHETNTAVENLKFTGVYGEEGLAKHYALFFAVNDYDSIDDLQNPIKDAEAIAKELETRFGFVTEVLRNPTFDMIDSKILEYKTKYEQNQNNQYHPSGQLLIFFTGHGEIENKIGYFLPKDVQKDRLHRTAIQYPIYQKLIDEINCNHILVVIDACFSGTFDEEVATRSGDDKFKRPNELSVREKVLIDHFKYTTRLYLTSGAKVETPDKSNFTKGILQALRTHQSPEKLFSARELYGTYLEKIQPKPLIGTFGKDQAGSSFLFLMKQ